MLTPLGDCRQAFSADPALRELVQRCFGQAVVALEDQGLETLSLDALAVTEDGLHREGTLVDPATDGDWRASVEASLFTVTVSGSVSVYASLWLRLSTVDEMDTRVCRELGRTINTALPSKSASNLGQLLAKQLADCPTTSTGDWMTDLRASFSRDVQAALSP
jgi:hypothetical protein